MRSEHEIEDMVELAYKRQGWDEHGQRHAVADQEEATQRAFTEGVEAGLLFVLGRIGHPFDDAGPT
jgi:hypothetical protein